MVATSSQLAPRVRVRTSIAWLLLLLGLCGTARADKASGTYTGFVEPRMHYYWDRATRVVVPTLSAGVVTPEGVEVGGSGLIDAITSASISAGLVRDVRFTEWRTQGSLRVGYEADLGSAQLRATVSGGFSKEPDYRSFNLGLSSQLSLNERNTVLHFGVTGVRDNVGRVLRGLDITSEEQDRRLNGAVALVGWDQVISPTMIASLYYNLGYLSGYLANRYRSVVTTDSPPVQELHPKTRIRHNLQARLAWYIPHVKMAVHAMYRSYLDSWELGALTPELRVFKEFGDDLVVRARYRYFRQTKASFFKDREIASGPYSQFGDTYFSSDPKMGAFFGHEAGLQVRLKLAFLNGTAFDFAQDAWADVSFDYAWRKYEVTRFDNRYGRAMIGMAGLRLPF